MSSLLNIENIFGYVATHPLRAIRDGKEFEGIIPVPDGREEIVRRGADVLQTVGEMKKLIFKYRHQTAALAKKLQAAGTYKTCGNIWQFLFSHILYKEDDKGEEQLRTPARSWAIRKSRGIDCDDFAIFASTLLCNMNPPIPHYLRIARYSGVDHFQHVYVVVPINEERYITIDAVLDEYDTEKETVETKDFLIMENNSMNGINVSVLSGVGDDTINDIAGILLGSDFEGISDLSGPDSEQAELGAIYNHLQRTRRVVNAYPELIKQVENPQDFGDKLDYALKYYHTDKRDEALGYLEALEDEQNRIEGLDGMEDGADETSLMFGLGQNPDEISILGKIKPKKVFFKKVAAATKAVTKKAGGGVKKAVKAVVRYNPATTAARGGVLLALKVNMFKIGEKLKWGYLTEREAIAHGFDMTEWRKVKTALQKSEDIFVKVLQGKAENFKSAILKGRAGGLNGVALGVAAAATAAATTAAASPFIAKIVDLLKNIDFVKLTASIKSMKLRNSSKAAEEMAPAEEEESAIPEEANEEGSEESPAEEGGEENPEAEEESEGSVDPEEEPIEGATTKKTPLKDLYRKFTGKKEEPKTETPAGNKKAVATKKNTTPAKTPDPEELTMIEKAMGWVQENPGKSVLIAGGLVLALSSTARKAIGLGAAPRKGKKKKGKHKSNIPKVITGPGRKRSKHRKNKNNKGGNAPTVKL